MPGLTMDSTRRLNSGVEMPVFGLGVFQISGRPAFEAVKFALGIGYRLIDTASLYGNEREVGAAVRDSGIPREDVFVTTKLWNSDHGYDNALRAFDQSLQLLGLEYVDLYLIHWPVSSLRDGSWDALAKIQKDGRCRAIGVSNYTVRHLRELMERSEVVPSVNQVEFNPFLYQKELLEFCNDKGIQLEAYAPLTRGARLQHSGIIDVARRYSRSPPPDNDTVEPAARPRRDTQIFEARADTREQPGLRL